MYLLHELCAIRRRDSLNPPPQKKKKKKKKKIKQTTNKNKPNKAKNSNISFCHFVVGIWERRSDHVCEWFLCWCLSCIGYPYWYFYCKFTCIFLSYDCIFSHCTVYICTLYMQSYTSLWLMLFVCHTTQNKVYLILSYLILSYVSITWSMVSEWWSLHVWHQKP